MAVSKHKVAALTCSCVKLVPFLDFMHDLHVVSVGQGDTDGIVPAPAFTATIWEMVSFSRIPLSKFMEHYPRGMKMLSRIKSTFRTPTGRLYGPQFIEIGIAIGEELKAFIGRTYARQLEGGASKVRDSQAG